MPQFELLSVQSVLINLIDILEQELQYFTEGQVHLTEAHLQVLNLIRKRQANLDLKLAAIHSDSM